MGWAAVRLEGGSATLLLQQKLSLTYEYRIFMVGGKPITGAGCLEEATPLWALDSTFSPLMRRRRQWHFSRSEEEVFPDLGERDLIEDREDLAQSYYDAAVTIGSALPSEASTCVIDLAWDEAAQRVVMIEANGMGNSGLYATQPRLVAEALAASL